MASLGTAAYLLVVYALQFHNAPHLSGITSNNRHEPATRYSPTPLSFPRPSFLIPRQSIPSHFFLRCINSHYHLTQDLEQRLLVRSSELLQVGSNKLERCGGWCRSNGRPGDSLLGHKGLPGGYFRQGSPSVTRRCRQHSSGAHQPVSLRCPTGLMSQLVIALCCSPCAI